VRDVENAHGFLEQLRRGRKFIRRASLRDVDVFVRNLATRLSKRTVAENCSSLRAFLRFLQMTGRLPADLASGVVAPRYRIDERPPRTLPWKHVQRILRSISRMKAPGKALEAMGEAVPPWRDKPGNTRLAGAAATAGAHKPTRGLHCRAAFRLL
jgi:integrase/recombinase XerD